MPSELVFEIDPNAVNNGDTITFNLIVNFTVVFTGNQSPTDKYDFDNERKYMDD